MRSLAAIAIVVAATAFGACDKTPPPSAEAGATTTTTTTTAVTCATTLASYDALVASGGACTTNADCVCFNGGVSPKTPCGGVTDKTSAAKLDALTKDYEAAHCSSLMCAAMTCIPACNAGHCANAPTTKPTAPP